MANMGAAAWPSVPGPMQIGQGVAVGPSSGLTRRSSVGSSASRSPSPSSENPNIAITIAAAGIYAVLAYGVAIVIYRRKMN